MLVAAVAGIVGLLAVLYAVYRDPPLHEPESPVAHWAPLPDPGVVARVEFPLSFPGYDPAIVEAVLADVAGAYADLLAAAPAEAIADARRRATARTRRGGDKLPGTRRAASDEGDAVLDEGERAGELASAGAVGRTADRPARRSPSAAKQDSVLAVEASHSDDLRAEAALARLEDER